MTGAGLVLIGALAAVTLTALALLVRDRARFRAARCDPLTRLGNRVMLAEAVRKVLLGVHALDDGDGSRGPALLLVDLDSFNDVNDLLGNAAGDAVLVQVAAQLTAAAGPRALVTRIGGDEFGILFEASMTADQAVMQGKKVLAALGGGHFGTRGVTLEVRASIGIVLLPRDGRDFDELVRLAGIALSEAKRGRSSVALYDHRMDPHRDDQLGALLQLRAAMDAGQLQLLYQPVVRADSLRPVGFEALVRWQHPTRGLLLPAEFIPVAELTNLIHPLTRWVMLTALRQATKWRADGLDMTMAVNISASSLEAGLLGIVDEALALTRWPASSLVLEITESAITLDPDGGRAVVEQLRARGVQISIDDFGAGFTSLALLAELPVHQLKIDRQFVTGLGQPQHDAIVSSIVDLSHRLGRTCVAEGVENARVAHQLAELGCDELQGYHFARPMAGADVPGWAARQAGRCSPATAFSRRR